jgi:hypothetical protein
MEGYKYKRGDEVVVQYSAPVKKTTGYYWSKLTGSAKPRDFVRYYGIVKDHDDSSSPQYLVYIPLLNEGESAAELFIKEKNIEGILSPHDMGLKEEAIEAEPSIPRYLASMRNQGSHRNHRNHRGGTRKSRRRITRKRRARNVSFYG